MPPSGQPICFVLGCPLFFQTRGGAPANRSRRIAPPHTRILRRIGTWNKQLERIQKVAMAGGNRRARFLSKNYTPYEGDASFLCGATNVPAARCKAQPLFALAGVWRGWGGYQYRLVVTRKARPIWTRERELIVGLQTARPLQRGVNPLAACAWPMRHAGVRVRVGSRIEEEFTTAPTHNDGVYRV